MIEVNHERGTVSFTGEPAVFFMASCIECTSALPFPNTAVRDEWVIEHSRTGHTVRRSVEVRPDGR
jgi:hypothetical protein